MIWVSGLQLDQQGDKYTYMAFYYLVIIIIIMYLGQDTSCFFSVKAIRHSI